MFFRLVALPQAFFFVRKKRSNFFFNFLDLSFHKKKGPAATPPAEKTCFLLIKNLYGKKSLTKKKCLKWSKILTYFFDFFDFFPNFVPDLGDQFWYNRLSFWAGLRSKKKLFFRPKFYFSKHFLGGLFSFFLNFVPDLGDQFGYNRLSFWAGRRPLKKCFFYFFRKFIFAKYLFLALSFHFQALEVVKKIFWKIRFFSSYPTLFLPKILF